MKSINKIYIFLFTILHLLLYLFKPIMYNSPLSTILYYLTPFIIIWLIMGIKKTKFKYLLLLIFLPIFAFRLVFTLLSEFRITFYMNTNCGENIKIARQKINLLDTQFNIVDKYALGLTYLRKNISLDNRHSPSNYLITFDDIKSKKNFKDEYEFKFYSECLPDVGVICPEFFIISSRKYSCDELNIK